MYTMSCMCWTAISNTTALKFWAFQPRQYTLERDTAVDKDIPYSRQSVIHTIRDNTYYKQLQWYRVPELVYVSPTPLKKTFHRSNIGGDWVLWNWSPSHPKRSKVRQWRIGLESSDWKREKDNNDNRAANKDIVNSQNMIHLLWSVELAWCHQKYPSHSY